MSKNRRDKAESLLRLRESNQERLNEAMVDAMEADFVLAIVLKDGKLVQTFAGSTQVNGMSAKDKGSLIATVLADALIYRIQPGGELHHVGKGGLVNVVRPRDATALKIPPAQPQPANQGEGSEPETEPS